MAICVMAAPREVIMWIKAVDGSLLNLNALEAIVYVESEKITVSYNGSEWGTIAEGDVRAEIATALMQNKNYLSLEGVNYE